jgi:phage terminase small subunit
MANVPHITEKQRKFVDILITKGTFKSGKDCATEAGYEESCATVMASKLQNPKYYPLVVTEIEARRNELSRRYSINYKSHLAGQGPSYRVYPIISRGHSP